MCIYIYIYIYTHLSLSIYIYIYVYTHAHTYRSMALRMVREEIQTRAGFDIQESRGPLRSESFAGLLPPRGAKGWGGSLGEVGSFSRVLLPHVNWPG